MRMRLHRAGRDCQYHRFDQCGFRPGQYEDRHDLGYGHSGYGYQRDLLADRDSAAAEQPVHRLGQWIQYHPGELE